MRAGQAMVRVLGPVQLVTAEGDVVELPSASQRRLLAVLALHAPSPVRTEWLCEVLGLTPGGLRTFIGRLRRTVGEGLVHTSVTGYRLEVTLDATLAVAELHDAGNEPAALRRALDRWRGPALDEFAAEPWAAGDASRLEEIRATATEDLAESLLANGRPEEALVVLDPHVVAHPFRDRPRGLVIRGLAAAGRQTEALRSYQAYRAFLVERGIEPSPELRRVEQRVAAGWRGVEPPRDAESGSGDERSARSAVRMSGSLGAPVELVGRRAHLDELAAAAAEAAVSGPRIVLVSGEAGIGKTTLIAQFAREYCIPAGSTVIYGRCDEHLRTPFQPFRELLARLVEELPDEVLLAHTATCGGDLLRLLPQLRSRVPISVGTNDGDEIAARHRLFEGVVDIVRRAAAIHPLVMIVDDLHWAEPAGLHLLRHLVRNLMGSRVLVIAGFRDTGDADGDQLRSVIAELAREHATRLALAGLDATELGDLVRARVEGAADRNVGAIADQLRTETAGNPLFAEHLLRLWSGSHQLVIDDHTVTVSAAALAEVPSTLLDLVWHRVTALGDRAQPALSAAAVLGVEFEERVLARMTGTDEHELADLLDKAVAAGLLAEDAVPPGAARFAHALVARALVAELGSRARTRLHGRAFDALLDGSWLPAAGLAPRLARHAELAGRSEDALHWAREAGAEALDNLAPNEAAAWFGKALDLATGLGRPDADRADLLMHLGEAAYRAGLPTAIETLHAAAKLAERCGADDTLIRAALAIDPGSVRLGSFAPGQLAIVEAAMERIGRADADIRARVLALLAQSLVHTDQTERRTAAAYEALTLARASDDRTLLARVAPDIIFALWTPETGPVRSAVAEEAIEIAEDAGDAHLAFVIHYAAFNAAVCAADAPRARRSLERARAIAAEVKQPRTRWLTSVLDTFVAVMEARFGDAEQLVAATFELGSQLGEPEAWSIFAAQSFVLGTFAGRHAELLPIVEAVIDQQESISLAFRVAHGIVSLEVGREEPARALLHEARERGLDAIPADLLRSTTLVGYAILALELEDVDAAGWLFPEIVPLVAEVSFNGLTSQGPLAAYAGKLASLLGRHGEAERHLLDALSIASSFGWEYHRATTLIALTQNRLRATGTLDAAGEAWLTTAERLCAAHGIASWAERAAALRC